MPSAEACDYVQHAPPGNDPLNYIFGDLLDTFTPSETAVLAALTHFTQPAQVQWIADVAQLAAPQAQTALEDLADRALLVSDPAAQAFTLPPLAAQFLRAKRPEAVAQSGDRLADRAYALALEHGYEEYDRFPTLEAEWPTLAAALPRFVQGENERLQTRVMRSTVSWNFPGGGMTGCGSASRQKRRRWPRMIWITRAGARTGRAGCIIYAGKPPKPWPAPTAPRPTGAQPKPGRGNRPSPSACAVSATITGGLRCRHCRFPASAGTLAYARPGKHDVAIVLNDLAGAEQLSGDTPRPSAITLRPCG